MFLKLRRIYWVRNKVQNFLLGGGIVQNPMSNSCVGITHYVSTCFLVRRAEYHGKVLPLSLLISVGGTGFTFPSLMCRRYLGSITTLGLCLEDKGSTFVFQNFWEYQNLSFLDIFFECVQTQSG